MDVEKARQQLAERQKRQKEEGRGRAYYNLPKTGRAVVRYLEQPDHSLGVVVGKHFNIPGIDAVWYGLANMRYGMVWHRCGMVWFGTAWKLLLN